MLNTVRGVSVALQGDGSAWVRDGDLDDSAILRFTAPEWAAFVAAVKRGSFDPQIPGLSFAAGMWINAGETSADEQALRDREAWGCRYETGTCLCPNEPFRYEGCRAVMPS